MLYVFHRGRLSGRVLFTYVLGTVMAYGLFPYFPSSPPRVVFPDADPPGITSAFRSLNLFLVGDYGIHSSVFPSAHVSSAFSAAWAMLLFLPDRKWLWRGMLLYAITVSIATVYGRYHYSVDALAGFGVSLAAAAITIVTLRPQKVLSQLR
jgi:membrane-associated phospholipid phosphatase